jgi:dolichyl-diphosphooligosaccharide--protein glycosyltransferase
MNGKSLLTIGKIVIIILILFAIVFALRAPASDLNVLDDSIKAEYIDSTGLPYFSEMDSYYNLRMTQDYVDHGYAGDVKVKDQAVDMHRLAPDGTNVSYQMGIIYATSWLHDLANNFFGGDYSVKEIAFWTGAIVASLAVIPVYIFARRITNDYGAIVATLIIVLAPNYFAHTFPGFFDTDMFYYIFSVFFVLFFIESIRSDNWIWKIVFAILAIVSIGLFSEQWSGWIFYVALMGLFSVIYLIAIFVFNVGDSKEDYNNPIGWLIHQKDFLSIVVLAVIAFAGLAIFKGVGGVLGIFSSVFNLLNLQSASVVVGGFPNVLISVAEMQMPALLGGGMNSAFLANTNGVVNGIGGILILFAALIVLYILVSRAWKFRSIKAKPTVDTKPQKGKRLSAAKKLDDSRKFKLSLSDLKFGGENEILADKRLTVLYATLFVVWVIVTALAVSRGSRFITTIVLPFGFLAGVFVSFAMDYIKNRMNNDKMLLVAIVLCAILIAIPAATINFYAALAIAAFIIAIGVLTTFGLKVKADKKVPLKKYVLIIALVLALVTPSVCGAMQTADNVVPGTSDAMWNAMSWIDETQPEDTVITSWWDFGYLFEIAADRQVTFDGGSQSGERAFWLGQAMTTDNLELSAGIFRMLDTTGDRAVAKLVNVTGDTGKSTDILIDILPRTASDAQNQLINKYNLSKADAKEVISYTHPDDPRPVIFVASSDMLQKAGWWSYFGAWNFDNQTSENYNYYVPYDQVEVKPGSTGKLSLLEDQGMTVNAVIERGSGNNTTNAHVESVYTDSGKKIMVNDTEYNPLMASSQIIIENGYVVKNETIKGCEDGNYTLFIMGDNNKYTPILISNELKNSMFTQLYLMGGAGQDTFENVHMENGVMLFKLHYENTKAGSSSA